MRIEILEPKKPLFWPSHFRSGVDTLTPCCLRLLSFYQELFQTDVHVLKRREWLFFEISRQIWPDRPDTAGLPAGYSCNWPTAACGIETTCTVSVASTRYGCNWPTAACGIETKRMAAENTCNFLWLQLTYCRLRHWNSTWYPAWIFIL